MGCICIPHIWYNERLWSCCGSWSAECLAACDAGQAGPPEGRYQVIYKRGDDLRQDQVVVQIFSLMDRLLKRENLDLKLTAYRWGTSPAGSP